MKRLVVLLAVLGLLFVVAVVLGGRERGGATVDTEPKGWMKSLRELGPKRHLKPDDVTSPCFDQAVDRFTRTCIIEVPDRVRIVVLVVESGTVRGRMQAEPADDYLLQDEPPKDGRIELDAFGEGGTLTVTCTGACRVALD